jgi:hypothetical protein
VGFWCGELGGDVGELVVVVVWDVLVWHPVFCGLRWQVEMSFLVGMSRRGVWGSCFFEAVMDGGLVFCYCFCTYTQSGIEGGVFPASQFC